MTVFIPEVGFRPGVGLALPEPVTVLKENDRGLRVMRLVATELGTELAFEIRDPDREAACETGSLDYKQTRAEVRLLDAAGVSIPQIPGPGNGYSFGQHGFGVFGQKVVFTPLPSGTSHVTLELRGGLGDWEVPLDLVPLSDSAVVPAMPVGTEQQRSGVTVRVVAMATTDDAIVLELQAEAGPTVRAIEIGEWLVNQGKDGFVLIDEGGRRVEELSMRGRMGMKRPGGGRTVVSFPRTDSRNFTLVVPSVVFQESAGSLELQLPIHVPTDLSFGRHPVRIRYANAVNDLPAAPGEAPQPGIEVQLGTVDWHDGRRVLRPGPVFVDGIHRGYSVTGRGEPGFVSVNIPLADAASAQTVTMRDPVVAVRGPWEIRFSRP